MTTAVTPVSVNTTSPPPPPASPRPTLAQRAKRVASIYNDNKHIIKGSAKGIGGASLITFAAIGLSAVTKSPTPIKSGLKCGVPIGFAVLAFETIKGIMNQRRVDKAIFLEAEARARSQRAGVRMDQRV